MTGHIRTRSPFFRVREPGNPAWSTSNRTWFSHSRSICVPIPRTKVILYPNASVTCSYNQNPDIAYPPPDTEVRTHLDWTAPNLREGQTRYLRFLGNLFRTVSDELAMLYKTKQPTYAALASSWRNHLDEGQNRSKLYRAVVSGRRTDVSVRPLFTIAILHSSYLPEQITIPA